MIDCPAGVSAHGRKHVSATNTEGAKAAEAAFGAGVSACRLLEREKQMKLKTRIIITFFVIVLVPLTLTGISFYGFAQYQIKTIQEEYGIDVSYENLSNSTMMLSKITQDTFAMVQEKAQKDPGVFEQSNYLNTLNSRLGNMYSFLLVRKDDAVYYCGTDDDTEELFELLPEYGDARAGSDSGVYIGGDVQALVKQADFLFADRSKGSAFIVTEADSFMPQMKVLLVEMAVVIMIVLIATSLCLSLWIYRGVIGPLNQLKKAAVNIKEGNLEFTVEGNGVDEINALCEDFEEMRKRLKDSAEEKVVFDQENKELISNISHDLKTPITAIKGYVEGIMDGVADTPEKMDKYIRTIYTKANEMDRLINELTFYSKIDTNRIPYTFSKINIRDYFDDCIEDISLELESENVELEYQNCLEREVAVIADAEQIKRVINNIISNSLKYMNKEYKKISFRLRDVGDFVQFEIEDNGRGISTKDLTNIFDRFYRTDASRNSSKGGSGIGLSIVRKILEDHGGKVWATSQLGTGTTMYFVLRKFQEVPADE